MDTRILSVVNILLSLLAVYLFGVYGRLHWWLRSAKRTELNDSHLSADFLKVADKLHLIAILLMLLVVVSTFAVLRSKGAGRTLGMISFLLACLILILLMLVRI